MSKEIYEKVTVTFHILVKFSRGDSHLFSKLLDNI